MRPWSRFQILCAGTSRKKEKFSSHIMARDLCLNFKAMRGSKNGYGEKLLKRARNSQRARAADGNRRLARLSNAVGVRRVAAITGVPPSLVRYHERKLVDPTFHAGRLCTMKLCRDLLTDLLHFVYSWGGRRANQRAFDEEDEAMICLLVWTHVFQDPTQTIAEHRTNIMNSLGLNASESYLKRLFQR